MARLDRHQAAKEVAQIGACIGREFSHELLATVSPARDNELEDALWQLVDSELIFRRGAPPEATYTFKHALVQDAAYGSLLKSRRQQLHKTVAGALLAVHPAIAEDDPGLLAHHYTEAGNAGAALPLWLAAGRRSNARYAHVEAIGQLRDGLALVE